MWPPPLPPLDFLVAVDDEVAYGVGFDDDLAVVDVVVADDDEDDVDDDDDFDDEPPLSAELKKLNIILEGWVYSLL